MRSRKPADDPLTAGSEVAFASSFGTPGTDPTNAHESNHGTESVSTAAIMVHRRNDGGHVVFERFPWTSGRQYRIDIGRCFVL